MGHGEAGVVRFLKKVSIVGSYESGFRIIIIT